jgi:hypothetical protein
VNNLVDKISYYFCGKLLISFQFIERAGRLVTDERKWPLSKDNPR